MKEYFVCCICNQRLESIDEVERHFDETRHHPYEVRHE